MNRERPVCEVCGNPATIMIRDTEPDLDARNIGINAKIPSGEPHYFCDEHKRESINYEM